MKKVCLMWIMVLGLLWMVTTVEPALAAYSAHQNDQDVNNFLATYPFAKGTKLDDCALCHPGGKIGSKTYGSCDYCHAAGGAPLNAFGQAYLDAGGNKDAFGIIKDDDSDGDGTPNNGEISALTFPGNPLDYPGLVSAPAVGMNLERLLKLPGYSEFLLLNASNSDDFYARYTGVKVKDLLKYAGIRKEATQITVFSPDGYSMAFPIDVPDPQTNPANVQYDVMGPYPNGTYYGGLDFVGYGVIPGCFDNGDRIPDKLYMLLAYMRDGDPLTPGKLNSSFKLDGEGPYRLIPPQKVAGSPDRSCKQGTPQVGDGWDCDKINKEHNAGFSARTVTAIRVDPLPAGTTDFNWYEGGWNLADRAKLVIYGAINPRTYPVSGKVSGSKGEGIPDVKLTFSLLSLGNVGEVTTSSTGKYSKKAERGRFSIDLPAGEYTVVPLKEGCTFAPASLLISIPDPECDLNGKDSDPWDHRERWEHCGRHPENEIEIVGSCP
ncbi:MAG: GEGP motif-containing diheme protein [Thermodesulfobacteriota bacterium]